MIAYVVLHYKNYSITKECIDSLLINTTGRIIIVDNASNNSSLEKLQEDFQQFERINFIKSESNLGFAKGNNLGYDFAIEMNPDFIVCLNNDTEIRYNDFESKLISSYNANPFWIMGPSIVNVNGYFHQNPIEPIKYDSQSINDLVSLRRKRLLIAQIKQIPFLKKFFIQRLRKINENRITVGKESKPYSENATLYGACIIYSKLYMNAFNYAFYPETFMFSEEYILNYLVLNKGGTSVFDPSLTVYHKEHVSTESDYKDDLKRELFMARHQLHSAKIFKQLISKE